jgi:hypothetical protein
MKKNFVKWADLIFIIISNQTASFEVQNIGDRRKFLMLVDLQRRPVASCYFIATGVLVGNTNMINKHFFRYSKTG